MQCNNCRKPITGQGVILASKAYCMNCSDEISRALRGISNNSNDNEYTNNNYVSNNYASSNYSTNNLDGNNNNNSGGASKKNRKN